MRHRGFVGSFSTSALLVTAAVSILLIVSAIVAFEGWPGPTGDTPTETFLLETSKRGSDARPGPEVVLKPAPPAGREGGSSADSGSGSAEPSTGSGTVAGSPGGGVPAPSGASSSTAGEAVAPSDAALPAPPRPTGGSPTVSNPSGGGSLGGAVDRATGTLDQGTETVAPVTDRVGDLVNDPAGTVNDLIGGR